MISVSADLVEKDGNLVSTRDNLIAFILPSDYMKATEEPILKRSSLPLMMQDRPPPKKTNNIEIESSSSNPDNNDKPGGSNGSKDEKKKGKKKQIVRGFYDKKSHQPKSPSIDIVPVAHPQVYVIDGSNPASIQSQIRAQSHGSKPISTSTSTQSSSSSSTKKERKNKKKQNRST